MKLVALQQPAAEADPLAAFGSETAEGGAAPLSPAPGSPSGRTWAWIAGLAIVLAGLAGAGVWMARRWATPPALGTVTISTTPTGAEVVVGGVSRGRAPVTFTVVPGPHTIVVVNGTQRIPVELTVGAGSSTAQHVVFAAGEPAVVSRPVEAPSLPAMPLVRPPDAQGVAAGFVSVVSPITLKIVEGTQVIGSSDLARLMLPAGSHDVELVNDELGFSERRKLTIASGKSTVVKIDLPKVPLNINAVPWADVSVDGQPAGETPIGNYSVTIGPHVITFRHPELGERQQRVVVGLKTPNRVTVDLKKDSK
jgi:hypothetical protein